MDPLDPILTGQPQQQPRQEPMKEEYPNGSVGWGVQTLEDGQRVLVCQVALPRKVMIFPMDPTTAAAVGQKLAAPSVHLPANGRSPS